MQCLRLGTSLLTALFLVALGAGCADTEFQSSGTDKDDDGYSSEVDCDDDNKEVFPGAAEKENCLDDNCDGQRRRGHAQRRRRQRRLLPLDG